MSGLDIRFFIQLLFYSVHAQNLVFILRTGEQIISFRGFGVKVDGLELTSIGSGQSLTVNTDGNP